VPAKAWLFMMRTSMADNDYRFWLGILAAGDFVMPKKYASPQRRSSA
jgi:hypothetical protein